MTKSCWSEFYIIYSCITMLISIKSYRRFKDTKDSRVGVPGALARGSGVQINIIGVSGVFW